MIGNRNIVHHTRAAVVLSFSFEGETKAYWFLRQGPWLAYVNTNKSNVCKKTLKLEKNESSLSYCESGRMALNLNTWQIIMSSFCELNIKANYRNSILKLPTMIYILLLSL